MTEKKLMIEKKRMKIVQMIFDTEESVNMLKVHDNDNNNNEKQQQQHRITMLMMSF